MSEKKKVKMDVYLETADEIMQLYDYLAEHDVHVSGADIVEAALILAKRMGAGNWSFVCEMKHRKENELL